MDIRNYFKKQKTASEAQRQTEGLTSDIVEVTCNVATVSPKRQKISRQGQAENKVPTETVTAAAST